MIPLLHVCHALHRHRTNPASGPPLQPFHALLPVRYEDAVRVICAWCEQEGKETLIDEVGLYDQAMTSHGICEDHELVILKQVRQLRAKQRRLRRRGLPRVAAEAAPRPSSSWKAVSRARRRSREAPPQLSLPFID